MAKVNVTLAFLNLNLKLALELKKHAISLVKVLLENDKTMDIVENQLKKTDLTVD